MGKGRKVRIVPISDHVVTIVKKYMETYRLDICTDSLKPLFVNKYNGKLTRAGITCILQKYANAARLEK